MKRQEIIESIKRDICQFNFPTTDVKNLNSKRAIVARDIVLPMIERMDNEWLQANRNIDIMQLAQLDDGKPSMKRITRLYPELLK